MRLEGTAIVLVGLASAGTVAGLLVYHLAFAQEAPAFRFATVERGDIQASSGATRPGRRRRSTR